MLYVLDGYETERLTFRLMKTIDYDEWLALFRNEDAVRFLGLDIVDTPEKRCDLWFEKVFDRYENDLGGMNVLVDKKRNCMIGQCGLLVQQVDGQEELEIGYSILPAFWKQGYATEAAIKCKEIAFLKEYAPSLVSLVHAENSRSKNVALKNGMQWEKKITYRDMPVDVFRIENNVFQNR
jgi:[ribosomal protein S5]-alanine N-acetyltransferase